MDDDPRQRLPMKYGKLCIPVPMKIHRLDANLCFFFIIGDDGGAVENFIFSPNNIVGYQIFRFPLSWIEADCGESAIRWRV